MEAKNIDDLIVADMNNSQEPVQAAVEVEAVTPKNDPVQEEVPQQQEAAKEVVQPVEAQKQEEATPATDESTIDEYGNPLENPKVYTEEEVNRLIRERLSRGKFAEQQQSSQTIQQQSQQQSQEQEENWQQELEKFVEQTIDKRQTKLAEQKWKQEELARQAEFETKFNEGMGKYNDFRQVVSGKPITDTMLLAARNLENPAAFVYGAAKFHAQDLERIAKITDPYAQAAEVGRLHEKMIKTKNIVSNAPKPIEAVTGDIPAKNVAQFPSLEQRIDEYAKQKRK